MIKNKVDMYVNFSKERTRWRNIIASMFSFKVQKWSLYVYIWVHLHFIFLSALKIRRYTLQIIGVVLEWQHVLCFKNFSKKNIEKQIIPLPKPKDKSKNLFRKGKIAIYKTIRKKQPQTTPPPPPRKREDWESTPESGINMNKRTKLRKSNDNCN